MDGFNIQSVYAEAGAAENGELYQKLAVSAGEVDDLSLKASESPADDSYAVAAPKCALLYADRGVGVPEDEA